MVVETNRGRLANDYDAIRRREHSLITDLLEVLPKINDLPEDYAGQARDALFHTDHPFLMVFVGPFSSGKTSIINALLGVRNFMEVGPVPTTDRISILRWGEDALRMESGGEADAVFHPSPLLKKVSFVDTPGLESVFQRHEDTTRRFLHRSDVVMLVMLSTQAMTASNVAYIQKLRDYGKKIIILINQADLLSPEERETVRDYVLDQSMSKLGFKPQVWMISAKVGMQAIEAGAEGVPEPDLWAQSGLANVSEYIEKQLSDVDRVRQKLQTPLQIMQSVSTGALRALSSNQAVIDQYQSINNNIEEQLAAHKREQDKNVRDITLEVGAHFDEAAKRGGEAIREVFRFSQGFNAMGRGLMELTGLARLFRRQDNQPSYVRRAFEKHKVFEPIGLLPGTVDKLGPRIEGRDVQDIDDLVKYGQRELGKLPPTIRERVIGMVQAPVQYDRRALQDMRTELERLEDAARVLETEKIGQTARNTLIYFALFELLVIVFGVAVLASGLSESQGQLLIVLIFLILGLGMAGLAFMPLAGRFIDTRYANQLGKVRSQYVERITKAADKQIEYGMRLRRDAIAPLSRLVEAQTKIQTEQLERLRFAEQEMARIEADLNKMGSRSPLSLGK